MIDIMFVVFHRLCCVHALIVLLELTLRYPQDSVVLFVVSITVTIYSTSCDTNLLIVCKVGNTTLGNISFHDVM